MNAKSILPRAKTEIAPESILSAVCSVWGIDAKNLFGRTRKQPEAFARQLAMSLCYEMTSLSLVEVGTLFDGRDHGTVLWAIKSVEKAAADKEVAKLIRQVIKEARHPTS